jgi:NAD(P)H-flavin reductase/NADPH-dependent glutamate synthase beta subunit-like oxidoreductase
MTTDPSGPRTAGPATAPQSPDPLLGIDGYHYSDLYDLSRLTDLGGDFDRFVGGRDAALFERFSTYRAAMQHGIAHGGLTAPDESELLIAASRELSTFLIRLFNIVSEASSVHARAERDSKIARFKKDFVAKRVAKVPPQPTDDAALASLDAAADILIGTAGVNRQADPEYAVAVTVNRLLDIERDYPRSAAPNRTLSPSAENRAALDQIRETIRATLGASALFEDQIRHRDRVDTANPEVLEREAGALHAIIDLMVQWAAARWRNPSDRWPLAGWTSFRLPHTLVFDRLVPLAREDEIRVIGEPARLRRRDGFKLTDARFTPRQVSDEAHYCIYCHERKKDSCAHGFPDKSGFKANPLGMPLEGCPLDEKIGEMNLLRAEGDAIAALAMVMIDNPMCPGTGHRICNDCMRSCIFQKQDPVNIPQIETGALTDVLSIPWGFEIYSLLTRWNPVHVSRPVMLPYNGRNILVVGLGPAGYTVAHYLANEGFGVVAIDALKIEPFPPEWIGGEGYAPAPIRDARMLWDELDDRILAGFGGVSEYGITVRWDKNFLKIIRIALERKAHLRMYGGVRFGGTLSIGDAFDTLGFDHIAVAAGAGTPTIVRMKNNLIRGIRKASDFLMALQLTGAFKKNSMANLQVRLPAIVIGGGLTAIDTATELFAYYPVQVEKIVDRFEQLSTEFGAEGVRAGYDAEELTILDEFLEHGRAIRAERERAAAAGEKPDFIPLVRGWGGVTIAYRKSLLDSPAYRLNFEEVDKAMEEGISYAESLSPAEAVADQYGHLQSMIFEKQTVEDGRWHDSGEIVELPARSLMVAAGTSPNVIYEKEHPGTFRLDKYNQFFQAHNLTIGPDGGPELVESTDPRELGFFTSYQHAADRSKLISFYGDNHPKYAGNVVKAMASAKFGYPHVTSLFAGQLEELDRTPAAQFERDGRWKSLVATLDEGLVAHVHAVNRLTPTIIEVVVRAPFAAKQFEPGQFYRLQNFESSATEIDGTRLVMEGLALTGAWTDRERGLLSLIILEMGGSSRLCAMLRPGEPVVVMGPTGTPTEIPRNETILLAGGGLGNAVLFSIARAFKENGCKVVYFAGYKRPQDVFKRDEIEAGTDQVIWAVDSGEPILPRRPQDLNFVGNIVKAMVSYATGELSGAAAPAVDLTTVTRIIAIGSDGMMRAVKEARKSVLAPYLSPDHVGIGSINSPMQCMMKQVCAQCLQRHVDPVTGKESFVFSCFNQDQPLDAVDFDNLRARLKQNTVVEKLTNLWLTRLLAKGAPASNYPSMG